MKVFLPFLIVCLFSVSPALAQVTDYDMTGFDPNHRSAGLSSFRITPDMYPKHSYHRLELMHTHGPKGKAVGYTQIGGKAFDYLNQESLNDKRNKPKASDPYLDNAYDAPQVDQNYNAAYHLNKKDFSSGLKPLGPKHLSGDNPFDGKKLFSLPGMNRENPKPFSNPNYKDKFKTNTGTSSDNYKVFDDESMF